MPQKTTLFFIFFLITLIFSACARSTPLPAIETAPAGSEAVMITESTLVADIPLTTTDTPTPATQVNEYAACGTGELIAVPYFFKDEKGTLSPTQLVRIQVTSDEVRRYVTVITCLVHDEGWQSDPNEVEGGYENEIIFFDKYGVAHTYRIIIGGHYIAPYDPSHKDITASLNGVEENFYWVNEWIEITKEQFLSTGVRQLGLDIYLEDTDGNLSSVLKKVYQFRETNLLLEEALKNGEGYPEQLPEGFFLFATRSWLIQPD